MARVLHRDIASSPGIPGTKPFNISPQSAPFPACSAPGGGITSLCHQCGCPAPVRHPATPPVSGIPPLRSDLTTRKGGQKACEFFRAVVPSHSWRPLCLHTTPAAPSHHCSQHCSQCQNCLSEKCLQDAPFKAWYPRQ